MAPERAPGGGPPPPGTTFLLIRHGATAHTAQGRFSGCTGENPPLSAVGERDAALLAARLTGWRVDAVVVSPVRRAHRTGEVLAAALHLPVHVEEDLRELDFGVWEGRTPADVERDEPGAVAAWRAGAGAPTGGESVEALAARVAVVRERWARRHPGGTVALVSHLYPARVSALDALGVPYPAAHRMPLEPTSVCEIRGPALVRWNDTGHLAR